MSLVVLVVLAVLVALVTLALLVALVALVDKAVAPQVKMKSPLVALAATAVLVALVVLLAPNRLADKVVLAGKAAMLVPSQSMPIP